MPDGGFEKPSVLEGREQSIGGRSLRAIGAFQTSELFLISALRLWLDTSAEAPCRRALTRNGFEAVGLDTLAYANFVKFLETIIDTRPMRLATAPAHSDVLVHDEAWLLECVALAQHASRAESHRFMTGLLTTAAAKTAAEFAEAFATSLTRAGFHIRVRSRPLHGTCVTATRLWTQSLRRWLHAANQRKSHAQT